MINRKKLLTKRKHIKLFLENKKRKAFLFFEKVDIKYYNLLQIDVLTRVANMLGFKKFNDFASTPQGNTSMKFFRKLTIDTFGSLPDDPNIPNVDKIKEVYNSPQKNNVVQQMASGILNIL